MGVEDPKRQLTVAEQNELAKATVNRAKRELVGAFRAVFGGGPGTPGRTVLAHLDALYHRADFDFPIAKGVDGHTDVPATFRSLGQRDAIDYIHAMLNWKEPPSGDTG